MRVGESKVINWWWTGGASTTIDGLSQPTQLQTEGIHVTLLNIKSE